MIGTNAVAFKAVGGGALYCADNFTFTLTGTSTMYYAANSDNAALLRVTFLCFTKVGSARKTTEPMQPE
ncbi:hypothetical protein [Lewinella sp. 4G2]|uniref:hypothetical protein n=1 Tax=Lewinella sp. 4G2 TaxID=1803372 RepID=UPI0007B47101|nr:hypothetical protein [Lewinella sp. 4G2]OAV43231.1 hypothetical protein A3850_001395 [Lewinella sp. 4G2]